MFVCVLYYVDNSGAWLSICSRTTTTTSTTAEVRKKLLNCMFYASTRDTSSSLQSVACFMCIFRRVRKVDLAWGTLLRGHMEENILDGSPVQ